jgi:hypothetical protein
VKCRRKSCLSDAQAAPLNLRTATVPTIIATNAALCSRMLKSNHLAVSFQSTATAKIRHRFSRESLTANGAEKKLGSCNLLRVRYHFSVMAISQALRRQHRAGKARLRAEKLCVREARARRPALKQIELTWARRYGLEPEPLTGALPATGSPVLRHPTKKSGVS